MPSFTQDADAAARLSAAFPRRLAADTRTAVDLLPPPERQPVSPFRVLVAGEPVMIPYRIYSAEPSPAQQEALSPTQSALVDCLYTRHHDGRVRQRRLERVIGLVEPWVAPFIVQLIGEYVEEIVLVIQQQLLPSLTTPGSLADTIYGRFAAENPLFTATTNQRVVSYWDCYHRQKYLRLIDYPGYSVMAAVRAAARRRNTAAGDVTDVW